MLRTKRTKAWPSCRRPSTPLPSSATARYFLGIGFIQANKPDQAESAWLETLRIDPRFALANLGLAQLKLASLDAGRARQYAEEALKIDPTLADALLVLGNAQLIRKEYREALGTFDSLVKLRPDSPIAIERLGSAYAASGDLAKAEVQLESALRINPAHMDALSALTNLYLQQKRSDKAVQRLTQSAQQLNQAGVYELLGKVYVREKNYAKAEDSFRKALSLDPDDVNAYSSLGELYLIQKASPKAIEEYENVLKVDPRSVSAHTMLGLIHDMRAESAKAEQHYREALKINPQSPVAATNLAWIIMDSGGNLDDALRLAQTANDKLPNKATILDTMGWIYYKKGAFASAVDLLKVAVSKAPSEPAYHYHLGMAYFRADNREAARAALDQALKLNPSFPGSDEAKRTLKSL